MTVYQQIDIKFADPVGALAINDKYVVSGTMMGRLSICSLQDKKVMHITEFSTENIAGINFNSENSFNVAIGDEVIVRYQLTNVDNQLTQNNYKINNNEDDTQHKAKCDGCFSILASQHVLLVNLPSNETTTSVVNSDVQITVILLL
jgi:hypothetical protein